MSRPLTIADQTKFTMDELNSFKTGDEIWVRLKFKGESPHIEKMTVIGFNCMGIIVKERGQLHFSTGLFYGFGYHIDIQIIYVKDKRLFRAAIHAEKMRLALPAGLAAQLKIERP